MLAPKHRLRILLQVGLYGESEGKRKCAQYSRDAGLLFLVKGALHGKKTNTSAAKIAIRIGKGFLRPRACSFGTGRPPGTRRRAGVCRGRTPRCASSASGCRRRCRSVQPQGWAAASCARRGIPLCGRYAGRACGLGGAQSSLALPDVMPLCALHKRCSCMCPTSCANAYILCAGWPHVAFSRSP